MTKEKPETTESDAGSDDADNDVLSDPSKGTDEGADWSDEGGATPGGPAT
ncbi:MAG: hypothetical protein U1D00_16895 [Mycobacterium sp.]|nr:hypothetical protein [Mycobacterium sp.]